MLMTEDIHKISGWWGYKRNVDYCNDRGREDQSDPWEEAEQAGEKERKILDKLKLIMLLNA
jgi:hypothetical protein